MRLRLKIWHRKQRFVIRQRPVLNQIYRLAVGVVGTVMMLAGLVMIPLPIPGPGWVTLFLGLAVLSTEFAWAHRATSFIRRQLQRAATLSNAFVERTRTVVGNNLAYHRRTMLAHARTAYTRISPRPVRA
ncbi:TIGR02611 family protein [Gordonia phosphorivorans]|uniref:TIGR02611 family protein n=1 Tax=Gordonia phosphorivorans TaxID=1056982 RepID=A0ABV6H923_9ACTN